MNFFLWVIPCITYFRYNLNFLKISLFKIKINLFTQRLKSKKMLPLVPMSTALRDTMTTKQRENFPEILSHRANAEQCYPRKTGDWLKHIIRCRSRASACVWKVELSFLIKAWIYKACQPPWDSSFLPSSRLPKLVLVWGEPPIGDFFIKYHEAYEEN